MSGRRLPLAAALALVLAAAGTGRAQDPLYLSAVNTLDYRRFEQDDLREDAFRNRLEVTAAQGIFTAWARLQMVSLSNAQIYDPYGWLRDSDTETIRVEESDISRRQFAIDTDRFDAQIGDWAHVFGRGLMLSVFEEEELNWDTRLDGFRGVLSGDRGSAAVLAGSNDGNRFRGAFVESNAFDLGELTRVRGGMSFVEAWGAEAETDIGPREQHLGGMAEVVLGSGDFETTLYGEYMERKFPGKDGIGALGTPGRGAFGAASVTWKSLTVSGEYRDFFRMEHEYHDPPTTLRQHTWTLLNRVNGVVLADIPDDDVTGGLGQAEWAYDYFNTLSASYARLEDGPGDRTFFEAYGEGKATWQEKLFLTVAAAESELELFDDWEESITGLGEIVTHLTETNSLSLTVEWAEVRSINRQSAAYEYPEEFRDRIFSLSYGRSPWLTLTGTYEDTTEDDPTEPRDHWFNVLVELNIASAHTVNLSYGSERGGWKCTGGICFFEPEFEGLKVKWVSRF
jgi:hypothetical protein